MLNFCFSVVYHDVDKLLPISKQLLQPCNQQQDEALKLALSQPLTVIQGCAGSGKTTLATKLGVMYTKRNILQQQTGCGVRQQVLICAPTEAGVDVINSKISLLPNWLSQGKGQ